MINVLLKDAQTGQLLVLAAERISVETDDDNKRVNVLVDSTSYDYECTDPNLLYLYDSLVQDAYRRGQIDLSHYSFKKHEYVTMK